MTLREALDRTILLMRDEVESSSSDDTLLDALTSTRIALIADAENLASHSAQTAFITAALQMARSGHSVHIIAPDIPMVGVQIPLPSGAIVTELLKVGRDILPSVEFSSVYANEPFDLVVALGDTTHDIAGRRAIRLNATEWSGSITQRAERWSAGDWPLGGLAAATLAAGEAFKCTMQKLGCAARNPERMTTVFAATDELLFQLAPEETPKATALGAFDCISGGAIIHAVLYVLSRLPGVSGYARVVEPDTADLSNLNRYAMLRRSTSTLKKATHLVDALVETGIVIDPVCLRFDCDVRRILKLAPAVIVGVDDIPTRWEVQRAHPEWLGIGATTHWSAMASFHEHGIGCAECAHPYDDPEAGRIPTVAFVSFWAGLLTASYFLRHVAERDPLTREQQIFLPAFRADNAVRSIVPVRERCASCAAPVEAGTS
jgi:hypothetical protein